MSQQFLSVWKVQYPEETIHFQKFPPWISPRPSPLISIASAVARRQSITWTLMNSFTSDMSALAKLICWCQSARQGISTSSDGKTYGDTGPSGLSNRSHVIFCVCVFYYFFFFAFFVLFNIHFQFWNASLYCLAAGIH